MRRTSGQPNARDWGSTATTRTAGLLIAAKLLLVASPLARAAHVIADARTPVVDGPMKDLDNCPAQTVGLNGGDVATAPGRVQAGLEEGRVRVNVPGSRHDALIE